MMRFFDLAKAGVVQALGDLALLLGLVEESLILGLALEHVLERPDLLGALILREVDGRGGTLAKVAQNAKAFDDVALLVLD
jgi:hypothetical protein